MGQVDVVQDRVPAALPTGLRVVMSLSIILKAIPMVLLAGVLVAALVDPSQSLDRGSTVAVTTTFLIGTSLLTAFVVTARRRRRSALLIVASGIAMLDLGFFFYFALTWAVEATNDAITDDSSIAGLSPVLLNAGLQATVVAWLMALRRNQR